MEASSQTKPAERSKRRLRARLAGVVLVALIASTWVWRNQSSATDAMSKSEGVIHVVTAVIKQGDVSVRLTPNSTVSAQQMVAVRPQLSAMIKAVTADHPLRGELRIADDIGETAP